MRTIHQTFRFASGALAVAVEVQVTARGSQTVLATVQTDVTGSANFEIDPGSYDYLIDGYRVPFDVDAPAGPGPEGPAGEPGPAGAPGDSTPLALPKIVNSPGPAEVKVSANAGELWDGWWTVTTALDFQYIFQDDASRELFFDNGKPELVQRNAEPRVWNALDVGGVTPSFYSAGFRFLDPTTRVMFLLDGKRHPGSGSDVQYVSARQFAVEIDGEFITPKPFDIGNIDYSAAPMALLLEFPEAHGPMDIRLWTTAGFKTVVADEGVRIRPIAPNGFQTRPKVVVLGDSWMESVTANGELMSIPHTIAMHHRDYEWAYNGQGGTGYVNPGPTGTGRTPFGSDARLDAVQAFAPDAVVVFGTGNDQGLSGVQVAASALYAELGTRLPGSKVVVIGPQYDGSTTAAVKAAADAASNVVAFIDPIAEGWVLDGLIGPTDNLHPNRLGIDHIAVKIVRSVELALIQSGAVAV